MAIRSPKHGLTQHVRGGWYKSINGTFKLIAGKREAATGEEADKVYEKKFAELWAGVPNAAPMAPATEANVSDLFDQFIHAKRLLVADGKRSNRTLDEYVSCLQDFTDTAGPLRFSDLRPYDFTRVYQAWSARFGVHRLSKYVAMVRTAFNWLAANGFIPAVPGYGDFRQSTRAEFRLHKARQEEEGAGVSFTTGELATLLDAADATQRAQILLALNGGFGNTDLSEMRERVLDFEKGWVDYRRGKTGVKRRCPLWPETIDAVRDAIPLSKIPGNAFSTSDGRPLVQGTHDRLAVRFKTLCEGANCYREDRGFYALRHVFSTEAVKHGSTIFVKRITGHTSPEEDRVLDEHYVGQVDGKLCEIVNAVRHALLIEWSSAQLVKPLLAAPLPLKRPRKEKPRSRGAGT